MVVAAAAQADLLARVAALQRDLQNERASVSIAADALQQVPLGKGLQQTPCKPGATSLSQETSNERQQHPLGGEACSRFSAGISQKTHEQLSWSDSPLGLASNSMKARGIQRLRQEISEELTRKQVILQSVGAVREENLLLQKELDAERASQLSMLAEVHDLRNVTEELCRDLDAQNQACASSHSNTVISSDPLQHKLVMLNEHLQTLKQNLRQKRSEYALQRERCIAHDKQMSDEFIKLWHEHEKSKAGADAIRERLKHLTEQVEVQRAGLKGKPLKSASADDATLQERIKDWQQQQEDRQQTHTKNRERLSNDLEENFVLHKKLREEFLRVQGDKYVLLCEISKENHADSPFEPSLSAEQQTMMEHCMDTFRYWWAHQNSELEETHNSVRAEVNAKEHEENNLKAQIAVELRDKRQVWASELAELKAACEAADEELSEMRAALKAAKSSQAVPEG
eukprot:gnl/MRDRNA2_/MRDRNA2_93612_c0_seq1.p1 gnl/MRDRNA2_/MRDRNA2_93612_c0~~gnl/MRDRNA2_/MRDRNA2_93612_c0_seq1.p1  ORF type:complete len:457 (+),score=111.95 gnl/MRDRNA2_/MRDRNA2_93612_c0_seq1:97-1467(+)